MFLDEQTELKKSFLEEQTDLKKSFENQTGLLLVSLGLINIALKEVSSDLNQTGLIKDSFKNQNVTLNHILKHSHKIEDYVNGTIIAHRQIEGKLKRKIIKIKTYCTLFLQMTMTSRFYRVVQKLITILFFSKIGNQRLLELKIDEVGCAIGLNSSFIPATNLTGEIGKNLGP